MTAVRLILESLAFFAFAVAVLGLLGLGFVLWLAPDLSGRRLLMAPLVGLGVWYLASEWLSQSLSSGAVMLAALALFGSFSIVSAFLHRGRLLAELRASGAELAGVITAGVGVYLTLLIPVFKAGALTLATVGGDGVYFYAPAAAYLSAHPYAAGAVPPIHTPALPVLEAFQAALYPGSMGTIEGAFSAISGRPVHAILDPLNALSIVLSLAAVYVIATSVLRASRWIAALAVLLVATNQFTFWTANFSHVQEMRSTSLMLAAVVFAVIALRERHLGAAAIAGGITGVMLAVYLPIFALLIAALGGAFAVVLVTSLRTRRWGGWPRVVSAAALTGGAVGIVNLKWLIAGGGLAQWQAQAFQTIPAGNVYGIALPPQYLLGTAPVADLYRLAPTLFWGTGWRAVATVASVLVVAALLAGLIALVHRGHRVEAGLFAAVIAYTLYIRFGSNGVYGWTKIFSFVLPFSAILVALGIAELATLGRRVVAWALPGSLLALILTAQVSATVETENMFLSLPINLPASDLVLQNMVALIPPDARTLLYDPALQTADAVTTNTPLIHVATYFLANRDVSAPLDVIAGLGTRPYSLQPRAGPLTLAEQLRFQFIVEPVANPYPPPPSPSFRLVWTGAGVAMYQRAGAE